MHVKCEMNVEYYVLINNEKINHEQAKLRV